MEPAINDIVLFQRIQQDDRQALNTLFITYYEKLCRFACTFSCSAEQAEEVVADVFFNLWKNRLRLDIHSNFRAYLYTAVKNAARDIRKSIQQQDYREAETVADPMQPSSLLEYEELNERVNNVIDLLPDRCRQVFRMSRFDGMKYREISEVLGISERTIEHHIVKALDIIRDSVERYDRDEQPRKQFTIA